MCQSCPWVKKMVPSCYHLCRCHTQEIIFDLHLFSEIILLSLYYRRTFYTRPGLHVYVANYEYYLAICALFKTFVYLENIRDIKNFDVFYDYRTVLQLCNAMKNIHALIKKI